MATAKISLTMTPEEHRTLRDALELAVVNLDQRISGLSGAPRRGLMEQKARIVFLLERI